MGHNLDLVEMYGLPTTVECPVCNKINDSYHNDIDIDCGDPIRNIEGRVTIITTHCCGGCDKEYSTKYKVATILTKVKET